VQTFGQGKLLETMSAATTRGSNAKGKAMIIALELEEKQANGREPSSTAVPESPVAPRSPGAAGAEPAATSELREQVATLSADVREIKALLQTMARREGSNAEPRREGTSGVTPLRHQASAARLRQAGTSLECDAAVAPSASSDDMFE
jgi:hypothetical protein